METAFASSIFARLALYLTLVVKVKRARRPEFQDPQLLQSKEDLVPIEDIIWNEFSPQTTVT